MFSVDFEKLLANCFYYKYSDGCSLFRKDKVAITNIDVNDNNCFLASGLVKDSNNSLYKTSITVSHDGSVLNMHCSCDDCDTNEPCTHIYALALKYNYEISNQPEIVNKLNYLTLLSNINENISSVDVEKKELDLEIHLNINNELKNDCICSLSFKVGENKKYVIKSIKNFLNCLDSNLPLQFGKGFTFNPQIHKFSKIDKEVFSLLSSILEIQNINSNTYYNNKNLISGKDIILPNSIGKRFFNILKEKPFYLKYNNFDFGAKTIICDDLPISFDISKGKNEITVVLEDKNILPIFNGEYYLYDDILYYPNENQRKFLKAFCNCDKVIIPENEINKLSKVILPTIKSISNKINITDNLKEIIIDDPLIINLYLDKIDDSIELKIEFCYGTIKFNPLNEVINSNELIIRDTRKETSILSFIETFGFDKKDSFYYMNNESSIINFISKGIDELNNQCVIYYSENFKTLKIHKNSRINSSIKLTDNNLLDFSFSIDNINKNELKDVLKSIKLNKKYHRLKNGSFLLLEHPDLVNFANTIDYLNLKPKDLENDSILLSKYNALYLDNKFQNNNTLKVEKNKNFRNLITNFKSVDESDFKVPSSINASLREYQEIGFKWFKTLSQFGFGGILADEMGLGKTLQSITFIDSIYKEFKEPTLVICPTSLVYNWESEFNKFAPHIKTLVISGNKDLRLSKLESLFNFDVIITSYPLVRIDIDNYKKVNFSYCFLDEAQQIKNPDSLTTNAIKEIKATGKFALTGTPIENSLTELWSIFDFIMPGYMLNLNKFKNNYEKPIFKNNDKNALEELNKHIKPFILRRRKKEVLKELPDKMEQTILIDLNEEQKKLYYSYVENYKKEIENEVNSNGFNKSKLKILSLLTRLRQLCCDPSSFIENYSGSSSKIDSLMEILDSSISENHRVLIFSQFTSTLKNISKQLEDRNIDFLYLDGSTKSSERLELVNKFNSGVGNVFLISLKAGGNGLNLTSADTVIHFDPWWNPAVENQATDRAHRIGQTKKVDVIKLITKGTIEEKIQILQSKKQEIFDMTIEENASSDNIISKMTEDDLNMLLS